jgi:hypothetical protein
VLNPHSTEMGTRVAKNTAAWQARSKTKTPHLGTMAFSMLKYSPNSHKKGKISFAIKCIERAI